MWFVLVVHNFYGRDKGLHSPLFIFLVTVQYRVLDFNLRIFVKNTFDLRLHLMRLVHLRTVLYGPLSVGRDSVPISIFTPIVTLWCLLRREPTVDNLRCNYDLSYMKFGVKRRNRVTSSTFNQQVYVLRFTLNDQIHTKEIVCKELVGEIRSGVLSWVSS